MSTSPLTEQIAQRQDKGSLWENSVHLNIVYILIVNSLHGRASFVFSTLSSNEHNLMKVKPGEIPGTLFKWASLSPPSRKSVLLIDNNILPIRWTSSVLASIKISGVDSRDRWNGLV